MPSKAYGYGCHEYFFFWEKKDGSKGTFPEEGSYLYGSECDEPLMWTASQKGISHAFGDKTMDELKDGVKIAGCSATGSTHSGLALGLAGLVAGLLRRRRR